MKTKKALAESLKNLLLQKPLNKITISDITDDCAINRMTFYYHFKDIYDLVEWTCAEEAAQAMEGKKTYDTWQEGFLNIFSAVQSNKPLIMNVYRCVSRERIEQYLNPLICALILGVVEEKSAEMPVSEADKRFIASFYEYAFIGVMLEWIDNNMREEPSVLVERTSRVVHGSVLRALNAFCTGEPCHSAENS
ncbi:hypothetical protein N510_001507 [Firmicutes bacterium ASF500]|nr:hypothetical protein N510_001507 [Firmicutes bacterium ASF500]